MPDLIRFISVLALIVFLVFLSGSRFLSVSGVNPNLILIFFAGLFFAPFSRNKLKLSYLSALLAFSLLSGFFLFDFWFIHWIILMSVIAAVYLSRNALTGRPFADLSIALALGTIIFYAVLSLFVGGAFQFNFVFWEIVYNLIFGAIFWFVLRLMEKFS